MIKRIKAACRTNDAQLQVVVLLTVLMLSALAMREGDVPLEAWLLALLFWPLFAFVVNLIDPIPKPKKEDDDDYIK